MAETAFLPGVWGRRKSTELFAQLTRLAERNNQPLCFAIVDLDRFKEVNDRFGHATGDTVLREFATFLMKSFRDTDVVGRWGGEEFILGLYGANQEQAIVRLNQIIADFRQVPIDDSAGGELHVTFSGGVAEFPMDGDDLQALYQAADRGLYNAKAAGRARVFPASPIDSSEPESRVQSLQVVGAVG
jgi:diguanylate cyclase (GGDEF)-like protein